MTTRGKWILATAVMLVFAGGAHAEFVTTQVIIQAPYGGASDVNAVVNKTAGTGTGNSYGVSVGNSGAAGTAIFDTGATLLGTFKEFNNVTGQFQNSALVETFAIQGHQVTPVGSANFTVSLDKGIIAIYAVPLSTFSPTATSTWGPNTAGSTLLYTSTITTGSTTKGQFGDQTFSGQPMTGQNQASFVSNSSISTVGALISSTDVNSGLLFTAQTPAGQNPPPPPNAPAFTGFQDEINELNALSGGGTAHPETYASLGSSVPSNGQLDGIFTTLAGLPGAPTFSTNTPFTTYSYSQNANANGPDVFQETGFTQYPYGLTAVPEPASIVLMSLGALGVGFYARRQRKGVPV